MQNKVSEFNKSTYNGRKTPAHARLLDIQSELGELSKEYLKSSNYGESEFAVTDDFKMEYGDVLYSLISLADELNISAEECLDLAIEKYKSRLQSKKDMGSGR